MATNIVVPALGESVTEATVTKWLKNAGEIVALDEPIVELETDKVTLEVPSPAAGTLSQILVEAGSNVEVGAVLAVIGDGAVAPAPTPKKAAKPASVPAPEKPEKAKKPKETESPAELTPLSPAVRKMVKEHGLDPAAMKGTGKDGRITKGDVLAQVEAGAPKAAPAPEPEPAPVPTPPPAPPVTPAPAPAARPAVPEGERTEERVRMTRLRRTIATRLKEAQQTAAMLTTFNEVDMTAVNELRALYRDPFQAKHGVRLGIMSFFVKAAVVALKELPAVNAQIDGDDVIYKHYVDMGIAVGTEQGLVVPILRDADRRSFAEVELGIGDLGRRARDGQLTIDELTGGTFTITNGGVYGSLMSTPILNPPQSAILGLHKTMRRPVAIGDAVEIRPMMYLALSYDHRIVDGREAVTFLVRVKECIEDPDRIMLDM